MVEGFYERHGTTVMDQTTRPTGPSQPRRKCFQAGGRDRLGSALRRLCVKAWGLVWSRATLHSSGIATEGLERGRFRADVRWSEPLGKESCFDALEGTSLTF